MGYIIKTASDGTKKIEFEEGHVAVVIPTKDGKNAVCVSCQIGCPVGCKFCYTGRMGFKRNLMPNEILNQIEVAKSILGKNPTTVVFMGMGEPLLNLKNVLEAAEDMHKKFNLAYVHITISTSCLKTIDKLIDVPFNIALSVHSVFDKERKKIMPASISIRKILDFAENYCDRHPKKELMIEYALIKGLNDSEKDLKKLSSLNWPKRTLFNFIQYNELGQYKESDYQRLYHFKQTMIDAGYKSFVRLSRGKDIDAACGMLDQNI